MTRLAIHLNDAGITLLNAERVLYREPGYAYLGDAALATGSEAFAHARVDPRRIQHRYWFALGTDPLSDHRFGHLSPADLASAQLEQLWRAADRGASELVVAVPAWMNAGQLGLFLGIAKALDLPVAAMVDAAVAATRREYKGAIPVHIDIGLHGTTLTRLAQPGLVQIDRSELVDDAGLNALYTAWMKSIAEAFVQQSRFDPLHTAETEQMLLDRLGDWLRVAANRDAVEMSLTAGGAEYGATVESLALIGAAAPLYQQIASKLRALYRAEDRPAIQVTDRVARLPGLTDILKARVGGEIFVLEPGATARGALARCRAAAADASSVSLLRQLPWDQSPVDLAEAQPTEHRAGVPTHLLFRHTAYAIGNSPLVLGSQEGGDGRTVLLGEPMPGVSRRHCTVRRQNGQCILEDHSRYGTFLNGNRVDGSTVLQVGDAVRIGSPGFEFQMITTDEMDG